MRFRDIFRIPARQHEKRAVVAGETQVFAAG
jgi:hypothetical protein